MASDYTHPDYRAIFLAKVTEQDTDGDGNPVHSWIEQVPGISQGEVRDASPARSGTLNAYEVNLAAVEVDTYVWIRLRGVQGGREVYEFSVGGTPATSPRLLAQINRKSYDGTCPVYEAIAVLGGAGCAYGNDPEGPCLDYVVHLRGLDLPVRDAGSPYVRAASMYTDDQYVVPGGATWENRSVTLEPGQQSNGIKPQNWCFKLPETIGETDVEILTVKVTVYAYASGPGVEDADVRLFVGGVEGGTSQHTGDELPTEAGSYREYDADGYTPSEWGWPSLTPGEINDETEDAEFGVVLRYVNTSGETRTVTVEKVLVELEFDPAGSWEPLSTFEMRPLSEDIDGGPISYPSQVSFDAEPWVDLYKVGVVVDDDGTQAFHRYLDQNTGEWANGRQVRLIVAE